MPGQTNNQTILAAANQIVAALNDLRTSVRELNMNVTQINNCGCCEGQSTTTPPTNPPTPPGQPGGGGPGDGPGPGQSEPTGTPQQIDERHCKMAIFLIDEYLRDVIAKLDDYNVDAYIRASASVIKYFDSAALGRWVAPVIASLALAVIGAALGVVITPGPTPDDILLAAIFGAFGVALYIYSGSLEQLEFKEIIDFIDAPGNRDKLVCALYSSKYGVSATVALGAVLRDNEPYMAPINRDLILAMFPASVLALLYYINSKHLVLEEYLASKTEPCPCGDIDPTETTPTDEYKCKAANYIFDSFTDTVSNWSGFSTMSWYDVANFILALGRGLLSNTFAGLFGLIYSTLTAVIPMVISYLGRLYWKGTDYFEALGEVAAQFEANKEAIICELYEAADVAAARAALEVHISDYVGMVMTAHPEWADEQDTYINVVTSLLPNTVLNELFKTGAEERAEITNYNPPDFAECAGCGFSDYIVWRNADGYNAQSQITEVQPGIYNIEAYAIGGGYGVIVEYTLGTQYNFLIALQSGSLSQHPSPGLRPIFKFVMSNYPTNPLNRYSGNNFPNPAIQCFNFLEMYSSNPFTISLEQSNQCT